MLFDHSAEYLVCSLRSKKLYREYLETGDELLKTLSEAYAGMAEDFRGPSKLFKKIANLFGKTNKANIEQPE